MKDPEVVYESGYSFTKVIGMMLVMAICAGIFAFFWVNVMTDNPEFAIPVMVIAALFFIAIGVQKVVVRKDGFAIVTTRVIPFLSRKKFYAFADMETIEAYLPLTALKEIDTTFSNIHTDTNMSRDNTPTPLNTLVIKRKDGKVIQVTPMIYRDALQQVLAHIRLVSGLHITVKKTAMEQ